MVRKNETKEAAARAAKEGNRWFSYTSSTETQRLWPRLMESRADVPEIYLRSGAFDGEVFPYAVFFPENVVFVNGRAVKTRQKMVAFYAVDPRGPRIAVLENVRAAVERTDHPLDQIQSLRVEDVLLSAVVSIRSPSVSSRIGFNSVRDNLFQPVIEVVRNRFNRREGFPAGVPSGGEPTGIRKKLAAVPRISLKFVNYGAKSLLPGQDVRAALFRESVNMKTLRKGLFRLIDHFSAPVLLLKTDGELIAVEEPAKIRTRKKMEYGGIFTFIPLDKVSHTSIEGSAPAKLVIRLTGGGTAQFSFPDAEGLDVFL
jgi:hypothetical protein